MSEIRNVSDKKVLGEYGELCFTVRAARLGLPVLKPYGDSLPYDFVIDNGFCLKRIQVKSSARLVHGAYHVSTSRLQRDFYNPYRASEIDFLAAYVIPEEAWYVIPVTAIQRTRTLALFPHVADSRSRFEAYREAWHLLLPEPSDRRIFARAAVPAEEDEMVASLLGEDAGGQITNHRLPELVSNY